MNDILEHRKAIMNNIAKSFGVENSEDSLEKGFEDEINPFEMEAYKSELTKAELDEFEKAKHQDGDMHPNGKWVWRQSANGGKGDWRVAKPSRGGGSSKTTSSSSSSDSKTTKVPAIKHQVDNFMYTIQIVNSNFTDESKVTVVKTDKGNWDTYYDGKRVGIVNSSVLSEKVAKEKGWLKEDGRNNEVSVKDVKAIETFPDLDEDKYLKRGNKVLKEYTLSVNINGKKIEGTTHEFWASGNLSNTSVGGFETTVYIGSGFPLDKHVKTLEEAKSLFLSTVKKKIGSSSNVNDKKKSSSNDTSKKEAPKKKVPSGKKVSYDDDIVAVYDDKGKKVYEGMLDYSPYQLDDSKWNEKDKNYDLPKGYKMVGK